MLAAFCLRLALGMVAFLPLLPADKMHPRFFRTQFLTALGLNVVAIWALWEVVDTVPRNIAIACLAICVLCVFDSSFDPTPFSRLIWFVLMLAYVFATALTSSMGFWWNLFDSLSSSLFLGAAVTAMLVGHSYLISPGLTIAPLITILTVLGLSLLLRVLVLGACLARIFEVGELSYVINEHWYFLVPRWAIGLGGPLVFGIMAYLSARIRSTQSATGILFVVVICTFLGELMSLVLTRTAAWPL